MNEIKIFPIGKIVNENNEVKIILDSRYQKGLKGLSGFSHVQVLWWMDQCDNLDTRSTLIEDKPYVNGPDKIGVFALRSPERPNPIAISTANISYVDEETGTLGLYYIDAFHDSIVLDIKPYTPSIDRVENPLTPKWCSHWPKSYEESGNFDWSREFNDV